MLILIVALCVFCLGCLTLLLRLLLCRVYIGFVLLMGLVDCAGVWVGCLLWWLIWFCVVVMFVGCLRLRCGLFRLILLWFKVPGACHFVVCVIVVYVLIMQLIVLMSTFLDL